MVPTIWRHFCGHSTSLVMKGCQRSGHMFSSWKAVVSSPVKYIQLWSNLTSSDKCVGVSCLRNAAGHVLPAWLRFFDTAEDGDGHVSLEVRRLF